jgi:maleate cis-trans isomerase
MEIRTTFKLTGEEIAEEDTRINRFSIRNISEIDLFDMVIDTRIAGIKLPNSLLDMINWACYHDMHFDGPFFWLTADEEFLDALAWHESLDD